METKNVLIVGVVLLILGYMFSDKTKTTPVVLSQLDPAPTVTQKGSGSYGTKIPNGAFKTEFMANCNPDKLQFEYCECTFKFLQDHYTYEELSPVLNYSEDEIAKFVTPAAAACIDLYNYSKPQAL